jgi:hypothetical protein
VSANNPIGYQQVFLLHAMSSELLSKRMICHRGPAKNEQSRSFLVEAVKDGESGPARFAMF